MEKPLSRYRLLLKRMKAARELGFNFVGTRYTRMPDRLRLFDKTVHLQYPNDPALLNDVINVILDDEYGLRSVCTPVQTVVDVGANIGLFSLWARHHFPNATIHAYEPNKEIYTYASANLSQANVVVINEGVSNESVLSRLVMAESSRLVKTKKDANGRIELSGIDRVIKRIGGSIDLLKMDCEGAEWEIFLGGAALGDVRQIRMEYHLDQVDGGIGQLSAVASDLGFEIVKIMPHDEYGIVRLRNVRFNVDSRSILSTSSEGWL